MSVDRFLQILESKKLTLVRPKLWDDPFESFLLKSKGKRKTGEIVNFDQIREKFYGQCWTLKEESDGIWRNYAKNENEIRVKTTVRELMEAFYDKTNSCHSLSYFIGKVDYYPETTLRKWVEKPGYLKSHFDSSGKCLCKTALLKRKEFDYEKEVRLIFIAPTNDSEACVSNPWDHKKDWFSFEINPSELFDSLLIDPRMPENLAKSFANIFEKLGYSGEIKQSTLYQEPYLWAPFD